MALLDRFRRIERSRGRASGEGAVASEGVTRGRIAGVEEGQAAPDGARTGAGLGRFAPAPQPSLELAAPGAGLPFTRCLRCGMDHHLAVVACTGCGARLDAPEQRAFNARLGEERRVEASREAAAEAERREARARAEAEEALARRRMGETLAREVGRRERARLDADGLSGSGSGTGWGGGWGRGWGRLGGGGLGDALRDPTARTVLLAAGVALAAGLGLLLLFGKARGAGAVVLFVLSLLLGRRRRPWRW